jgi:hypothetical protein
MKLPQLVDLLFHNRTASYKTYVWRQLPPSLRIELFKQNVVQANDYKNLVYFVFEVDSHYLILVDIDYKTLKSKLESVQKKTQFINMVNQLPYYFIV